MESFLNVGKVLPQAVPCVLARLHAVIAQVEKTANLPQAEPKRLSLPQERDALDHGYREEAVATLAPFCREQALALPIAQGSDALSRLSCKLADAEHATMMTECGIRARRSHGAVTYTMLVTSDAAAGCTRMLVFRSRTVSPCRMASANMPIVSSDSPPSRCAPRIRPDSFSISTFDAACS